MCENTQECDIYHDLISDHLEVFLSEMDVDKAVTDFPYKNAISRTQFMKLVSETDKREKGRRLIKHLLTRRQLPELKALFSILTDQDPQHYLITVLKDRLVRCKVTSKKDETFERSTNSPVPDSEAENNLDIKDDADSKTEENKKLTDLQSEKNQLEKNLDSAQKLVREKTEENDFLRDQKSKLISELEAARKNLETLQKEIVSIRSVNSGFQSNLEGTKGDIRSLQVRLDTSSAAMSGMKDEIKELKGNIEIFSKELEELEPLKKKLTKEKKSKICLLM